jgi:hypothetical protein
MAIRCPVTGDNPRPSRILGHGGREGILSVFELRCHVTASLQSLSL